MFRRKQKPKEPKTNKRQRELIEQFDNGLILQVDNGIDNKKHFNPKNKDE